MNNTNQLLPLENTLFYALDKAIKSYRQYAQYHIKKNNLDITVDQWLVLKTIYDHPDISQKEIADMVFKDYASITRMIELLVKRNFLKRFMRTDDRRRFDLKLSFSGKDILKRLVPIVQSYRSNAIANISEGEISTTYKVLNKIINNCSNPSQDVI
jgi:DNA-binding MarR family transcriptional regulator